MVRMWHMVTILHILAKIDTLPNLLQVVAGQQVEFGTTK